jgi:hypothetical protein
VATETLEEIVRAELRPHVDEIVRLAVSGRLAALALDSSDGFTQVLGKLG